MYKLMTIDLGVSAAEANEVAKLIRSCPIQRFLQIKDMAIGRGFKAWQ
jgi:hypothetical protein